MKLRHIGPLLFLALALTFTGCASYVQRIVLQSLGRIGQSVPAPPHMVSTPMLPNAKFAVSWIGHATVLLQIDDKLIITDPFLTNTIGMVVKRSVGPGLDPALLPKMDVTLISHIHFDHLSYGSLAMLPKNGILAVPLGAGPYTPDFGFKDDYEMKPWDVIETDGIRVTAVPVQHFTGRYGIDAEWLGELGYTGYVIEYGGYTVFFAGDTGYNSEYFKEIGRRFKIDLALIPIAPGGGGGIGSRVHVNPLGALMILKDVGAKYMLPIHYGTLFYGPETNPTEPLNRLREAAAREGVSDKIIGLEVGEQHVIY